MSSDPPSLRHSAAAAIRAETDKLCLCAFKGGPCIGHLLQYLIGIIYFCYHAKIAKEK